MTPKEFPKNIAIFIYDLSATGETSLKKFDRFMMERPQDVPVIVLSPPVEDALLRWFLRLRVSVNLPRISSASGSRLGSFSFECNG